MRPSSIGINVEVQPLPHLPPSTLGEGSNSSSQPDVIAYATDTVFEKLARPFDGARGSDDHIYTSIQWPEERRLAGKGKSRNLVIQVRRPPGGLVSQYLMIKSPHDYADAGAP